MLGISRATLYRKLKRYNIPMRPEPADVADEAKVHAASHCSTARRLTSRQRAPRDAEIAETFAFQPETRRAPFNRGVNI